ncbi:lysosome-associated membrane glycoprotein 1-like [Patiria miniata]|uniref:Lysosome-associated membrane glycoprotein 5 n=1 Tax=Patiria miniata TaxID=46514 RepID=A0A914BDY7_PATMI|nr:lysosome-associated membrane glycoprotein 1-like [Patiria miniata]
MASEGRRKGTSSQVAMTVVRSLLILWICSGLCVCVDEVPIGFDQDATDTADVPAGDQPSAADTEPTDQPLNPGGSLPPPVDVEGQEGDLGSEPAEDTQHSVPEPDQPDQSEAVEDQSEAVQDQSEAPQEEGESAFTEMPPVETEANPVSTKEPAEPTEQPQELGDFVVRNDDGVVCLRACFAALLKVDYLGQDEDGKAVNRTAEIPIPKKADVGGFCNRGPDGQAALELRWDEEMYSLKITFQKQNSTIKGDPNFWDARVIQFTFDTRDSYYFGAAFNAGERVVRTKKGATFFATPQGNSRVCEAEDDIVMQSTSNNTEQVTLEISQLQLQPYGMQNGTFSEGVDCGEDLIENPNTNVASIAVGATLACLILVVIIVYAVGRKMGAINDRSGYKSVE